jgi:hypothetical protein
MVVLTYLRSPLFRVPLLIKKPTANFRVDLARILITCSSTVPSSVKNLLTLLSNIFLRRDAKIFFSFSCSFDNPHTASALCFCAAAEWFDVWKIDLRSISKLTSFYLSHQRPDYACCWHLQQVVLRTLIRRCCTILFSYTNYNCFSLQCVPGKHTPSNCIYYAHFHLHPRMMTPF